MHNPFQVQFIGATGTVTGSKYLVSYGRHRILIDCGLFQGLKDLRTRNWAELPFAVETLDAVLLTHAHIDHSGYLPALMKRGFKGPIYATHATTSLCKVLLPDAGFLQEEDARYANRKKFSKHMPAEPLFTEEDARKVLKQFKHVKPDTELELPGGLTATFTYVGHILGACSIRLTYEGTSITFSGDVGRLNDAVMPAPQALTASDYLVLESTYGDRIHPPIDAETEIAEIINRTIARGGIVLMPAFAVGRAQLILHYLQRLAAARRIPRVPIYLNSPMAIQATTLLKNYSDLHKLTEADCNAIDNITTYVKTYEESVALVGRKEPAIIISASGMASGGRVLHHLKSLLSNPRHCILFLGYQAAGTRGYSLTNGATTVKIHGETHRVEAEIINLDALSSHADYQELTQWLKKMPGKPKRVFITHGEGTAATALSQHLRDTFGWHTEVPEYLETIEL